MSGRLPEPVRHDRADDGVRRRRGSGRTAWWGVALLCAPVCALATAAPAGAAPRTAEQLPLEAPEVTATGEVRVVARVPDTLTGRALPATAFTAEQAGRDVPVTAVRLAEDDTHLVLVVDTAVEPDVLAAQQAAAADLLRALPPELPSLVRPGGAATTASRAVLDVGALRPGDADLGRGLPEHPSGRQWLVVLTDCAGVERLPESSGTAEAQLWLLVTGSGCQERARELAVATGGTARTGLAGPAQAVAAADAVAADLLGQYRLEVAAQSASGPVEVTVASAGLTARGLVPGATTTSTAPVALQDAEDEAPSRRLLVGLALLTAAAAVAYGIRDLRTG